MDPSIFTYEIDLTEPLGRAELHPTKRHFETIIDNSLWPDEFRRLLSLDKVDEEIRNTSMSIG